MEKDNLLAKYNTLNSSFKKELTFRLGIEAGFFSEYNNMILAMLYCLCHGIKFKLSSKGANFCSLGWNGYFQPFCEDVEDGRSHFRPYDWKYSLKLIWRERSLYYMRNIWPYFSLCWKRNLLTQDVFASARNHSLQKNVYHIPALDIKGDLQQACSQLVRLTWIYNQSTQVKVNSLIKNLSLPINYIGMHIRGGDKYLEHVIEPLEKYFDLVDNSISEKNLFVLTDDYRVILKIQEKYSQWNVYTLCGIEEKGYFHSAFSNQTEEYREKQLIKLFASVDILAHGKQFIGTFSSNPGMYLGMRNPAICSGVDFDRWLIW